MGAWEFESSDTGRSGEIPNAGQKWDDGPKQGIQCRFSQLTLGLALALNRFRMGFVLRACIPPPHKLRTKKPARRQDE
jgi:hypothetical protein